ncbi:heterokaryon incompatibility, partial [Colletotrichum eremochloae]
RLIDCGVTPPSVVRSPPEAPYLALSYVWGQHGNQGSIGSTFKVRSAVPIEITPRYLPKTILDAQLVVRKLGYRYLWVDQICINQEDPDDKQSQIEIMDKIYGGAELTIVAAAGSHNDYGLPGVSSTLRQSMQSLELDGIRIVRMPNDPSRLIRSSTWSTRAWT